MSAKARSYLVECYWPGVSAESFAGAAERTHAATLELQELGRELRFHSSILVLNDETIFCLFDGDEADVHAAVERAGMPFERVLESLRIDGSHEKEAT